VRPLGHLLTSAAFGAGLTAASGSPVVGAAALVAGTLIDVDHYTDYVFFSGRRDLHPLRFLQFYRQHRYRWVVLALHSWEWVALSGLALLWFPLDFGVGLWLGAVFHLMLDLGFNAPLIRRPFAFYSLAFRASRGFEKEALLHLDALEADAMQGPAAPGL
jgi:hypothetical protein